MHDCTERKEIPRLRYWALQKHQEIAFMFDRLTIKFSIIGGEPFKLIAQTYFIGLLKMRDTKYTKL